jgi:hypothetical protein
VSPPQIVGLSNGVAQSIVSLARGFGPLLGGYVRALARPLAPYALHLLTPPFRYGPQRCKGTRRDTTSGSSWLARRARWQSSTASSSANAKQNTPLSAMLCTAITPPTNDTIWTITLPHCRLFTIFFPILCSSAFLLRRRVLCMSKANVAMHVI